MIRFLVTALATLITNSALASGAIVDEGFVAAAAGRGAIIWDARSIEAYRTGHIPGAVAIGHPALVLRNPNTEDFIPLEAMEKILGAAGIDPAEEIVVYAGRGDSSAYFALYTLQYLGARRAHVYHDGFDGWRAAGRPVSREPTRRPPVSLRLKPDPGVAVTTPQMLTAMKRSDVQVIDVRTQQEFRGEDIRAIRGGHIPGAINIPHEQNWIDPDTPLKLARRQTRDTAGMSLKPHEELKRLYSGLDPNKETIVYCQSGIRAAQTAAVLSGIGFRNVKVYDSSWLGYAGVLSAPANNEVFFNVGAMNAQLRTMQWRIEQLERELSQAREKR